MIFKKFEDKNINKNLGKSQRYTDLGRIQRYMGYTLAEVLITLGVLGVVAVLIVPRVMNYVNEMSWMKAADNFEAKIEEATKQMNVNQVLSGYSTNEAFVDTFQNYIKISKRCTVSNMSDCFVSSFKTASNEDIDLSTLKKGTNFSKANNTSDLVGAQVANGTNAIIAFDPDCETMDWYNSSPGAYDNSAKGTSRSYSPGATTTCLAMMYDVNGFKKPNTIGKDIVLFHAALSICSGTKIGNLCVDAASSEFTSPAGLSTPEEYQALKDAGLIKHFYFDNINYYARDSWAAGINECNKKGMRVPDLSELAILYDNYKNGGNTLGLIAADYWSSTEYSSKLAWYQNFSTGNQYTNYKDTQRRVRCVR